MLKSRAKREDNGELIKGSPVAMNDGMWIIPQSYDCVAISSETDCTVCYGLIEIAPSTLAVETGVLDKNKKMIFGSIEVDGVMSEGGDTITFLLAFPVMQTHTGENIPNGSYTEPDEPFFHKVKARVYWDNDRGQWSCGIKDENLYGLEQQPMWHNDEEVLPIIRREPYCIEYIKSLCGECAEEDCSDCEYTQEMGVSNIEDMKNALNEIEIIDGAAKFGEQDG